MKDLISLMPEVLAALQGTGANVSLSQDLEGAIEADRQARSEPVAADDSRSCAIADSNYAAGMLIGWNLCVADDEESFTRIRGDRLRAAAQASRDAKAQDAAPQPAEPVKVPSDDEIISIMSDFAMAHETDKGIARYTKFDIVDGVRALLAKYSEQTRECSEHHTKCSEHTGYAAEDMADQGAQAFRDGLNAALKAAQDARDSMPLPQYHGASRCVAVIKELIESEKK